MNPKTDVMISDMVFPPLGLWYVSAALKVRGHEVTISDLAFDDEIPDADIYGVTGTEAQMGQVKSLIESLKQRRCKLIVGGPFASVAPRTILGYGADAVLMGEAEENIADVLKGKKIIKAERITDLDSIPFPDRTQCHRYGFSIDNIPTTTMMTSRGCPYRCAFCSKPLGYDSYLRSVDNIMAEIREIRDVWGFRAIMFVDDNMGIDPVRLQRLCEQLRGQGMIWRCLLRAEHVSNYLAEAMKEAGCVEVGIGIESGSNRILHNIQKGETVGQMREAIATLHAVGIRVKGFFIVGLPGEDRKSLADTEHFLESVRLDDIDICILSVYRGSPIWQNPERYDVIWNGRPMYYKVDPANYECGIHTSALSSGELLEARAYLEGRFKEWTEA